MIFDANQEETVETNFEPIPKGDYLVEIESVEKKPTRNGKGEMVTVILDVIGGPYSGRKIWGNHMFEHESQKARAIGRSQLKELCIAAGVPQIRSFDELMQKQVYASIVIETGTDNVDRNRPAKYRSKNSKPVTQAVTTKDGLAPSVDDFPF